MQVTKKLREHLTVKEKNLFLIIRARVCVFEGNAIKQQRSTKDFN